jgi:hypothetical protein
MPLIRNSVTGVYDTVPDHYIGDPILGKNLVVINDELQVVPNKEITKEQPAPEVEPVVVEPVIIKKTKE